MENRNVYRPHCQKFFDSPPAPKHNQTPFTDVDDVIDIGLRSSAFETPPAGNHPPMFAPAIGPTLATGLSAAMTALMPKLSLTAA